MTLTEAIKAHWKNGAPLGWLAQRYELSVLIIKAILGNPGVKNNGIPNRDMIEASLRYGSSATDIAEAFGIDEKRAAKYVEKQGLEFLTGYQDIKLPSEQKEANERAAKRSIIEKRLLAEIKAAEAFMDGRRVVKDGPLSTVCLSCGTAYPELEAEAGCFCNECCQLAWEFYQQAGVSARRTKIAAKALPKPSPILTSPKKRGRQPKVAYELIKEQKRLGLTVEELAFTYDLSIATVKRALAS